MTKIERKVEKLVKWLSKESEESCEIGDGQPYPDDVMVLGDYVVRATLDAGKEYGAPQLEYWTLEEAAEWHDRIVLSMNKHPHESLSFHVHENAPDDMDTKVYSRGGKA